jgi:hypothetical protein
MVLRSDEMANEAEVGRDKKFRSNVGKGVATAASLGAGALGGLSSKILPFLNQYIPAGLAMQGISKVAPKLGTFLQKGQEMGLDVQQGLDFLKDKLSPKEGSDSKEKRNIIEQYDPDLFRLLKRKLELGDDPGEAASHSNFGKYKESIKKMEKDHKMPFADIVKSVFGQGQMGLPQQQQQAQQQAQMQAQQQQQMQGQQLQQGQQGQGGQGQQALAAILQKIQARLAQ